MFKKVFLIISGLLLAAGIYFHELVGYGWMQAKGQVSILMNTKPIPDVLTDPTFPDSLKKPLRLIGEIKRFAVDSLGLDSSDSYTKLYDQHGKPILWVLTASERYQLKAKEWDFPIIGAFSYKGFFDSTRAQTEETKFINEGYDTQLGEVSAWSTLGFLSDPVLSSMLYRSEGSLANLIIHEMTHGTLFVKNNLELNENLASFVGDYGASRFLKYKFGADSPQFARYEFQKKYGDAFSQHILGGVKSLDSLYKSFDVKLKNSEKDTLKTQLIRQIMASTDTLLNGAAKKYRRHTDKKLPNNAFFVGYLTYKSRQNDFNIEFTQKFNSDFKKYLTYLKTKYPTSF